MSHTLLCAPRWISDGWTGENFVAFASPHQIQLNPCLGISTERAVQRLEATVKVQRAVSCILLWWDFWQSLCLMVFEVLEGYGLCFYTVQWNEMLWCATQNIYVYHGLCLKGKPWSWCHPLEPDRIIINLNRQEQICFQRSATAFCCPGSLQLSAVALTVCNCLDSIQTRWGSPVDRRPSNSHVQASSSPSIGLSSK